MKILELEIKGFRSLKDISWKPGNLNVVIGPNGTGKSNLLRILELISISAKGKLGKYILNFGGMEPLVWDGVAEAIKFIVNLSGSGKCDSISYDVEILRIGKSSSFIIEKERLDLLWRKELNREYTNYLERNILHAKIRHGSEMKEVKENTLINQETILSAASGPTWETDKLLPIMQTNLDSWEIYHDLDVTQQSAIRQAAIARVEKQVDADGQNLIPVLHTLYTGDRDFKKSINLAMRAAFGNDFEELVFPPAADQRIQLRVRWKSLKREQSAADLSDGTLRFLFLLTVLASPSPSPIIAIDEPETGLHPSMLPIIAEYAVDAAERAQVIFTTHSPQFLDAFKDTKPTTTVAKWSDGETILNTLDGKELEGWLKEYSLGSLFLSGELEAME